MKTTTVFVTLADANGTARISVDTAKLTDEQGAKYSAMLQAIADLVSALGKKGT